MYGYLLTRCRDRAIAEDLTAETFLAAVSAVRKERPPALGTAWLIGVARHKLVDHWRRQQREERGLRTVSRDRAEHDDPWELQLDVMCARQAMSELGPHHRSALTLRYLDGLPVAEVARHLGRSLHATEALLVRARRAFRRAYEGEAGMS